MNTGLREVTPGLAVLHSRALSYNAGVLVRGQDAVLVDAGLFADEVDQLRSYVYARAAAPTYVVVTHSHWDHVLGPEYFPGVPVVQQQESLSVFAEHHVRIEHQVTEWERQSNVHRDMPFLMPEPDETFTNRFEFALGDKTIELLHAPGHAPEQLVVYDRAEAVLWAADMLSDIEIPFVMHSLRAYRQTLDQLAGLEISTLVPGHGRPAVSSAEVRARLDGDRSYLAELQRRVEAAVAEGRGAADTLACCADMKYPDRDQNEGPHRLNVETAYLELGGKTEPGHDGWNRFQ